MKVELRNNKDFLAGLLLLAIGGGGFLMALDYPFGSALRMGPGYFPRVLAGILMAFGVFILIRSLLSAEKVKGRWGWKPLAFITVSLAALATSWKGWVIRRRGWYRQRDRRPCVKVKEVAILTVVRSAFRGRGVRLWLGLLIRVGGSY